MKRTYHVELWHWPGQCGPSSPVRVIGEYPLPATAFQVAAGILAGAFPEYPMGPTGEIWIVSGTELLATMDRNRRVAWKCQFLGRYCNGRLVYAGNDPEEAERAASQDHVSGRPLWGWWVQTSSEQLVRFDCSSPPMEWCQRGWHPFRAQRGGPVISLTSPMDTLR